MIAVNPSFPPRPCIRPSRPGMRDPGSGPVDCTALNGIETSPGFYDTFEPPTDDGGAVEGGVGVAIAWTGYDDLSWGSFHVPGDITWYAASPPPPIGCVEPRCDPGSPGLWGLAAYPMGGPSCNGEPNNWSLHFRGGLFRNWGGGASSVFTDPRGSCEPDADICPPPWPPGATVDSAGIPADLPDGGSYAQSHAFVDASALRRSGLLGADRPRRRDRDDRDDHGQLHERSTGAPESDVLSASKAVLHAVPERRTLHAHAGSQDDGTLGTIYRCFDPASGPFPGSTGSSVSGTDVPALTELLYPRCGQSACSSPTTYIDLDFDGKACRPYTFPAADYSAEYCWNVG